MAPPCRSPLAPAPLMAKRAANARAKKPNVESFRRLVLLRELLIIKSWKITPERKNADVKCRRVWCYIAHYLQSVTIFIFMNEPEAYNPQTEYVIWTKKKFQRKLFLLSSDFCVTWRIPLLRLKVSHKIFQKNVRETSETGEVVTHL